MPEDVKPWNRFLEFLAESTRIFRGFSMALDAKKLVFALAGVVLWAIGSMIINVLSPYPIAVLIAAGAVALIAVFVMFARTETETASKNMILALAGALVGVVVLVVVLIIAFRNSPGLFDVLQLLWGLLVAALFGTGIARVAALNAAADETLGPRETSRFALKKFSTSVWTLLVPVLAVLVYGLVLIVLSILGRVEYVGDVWYVLIGVLYIVPLLGGLFFAAVMIVYLPSLLLFQPAIAAEGNDSFDAVSRAYSYVFGRPWRLAFYSIIAFIYASIVLKVAALLVIGAGLITNAFIGLGVGEEMASKAASLDLRAILGHPGLGATWTPALNAVHHFVGKEVLESFKNAGHVGGWLIVFWQHILLAIFLAFAVSILYSLMTQIYFLMRKAVDGTPFEEIYIETPEEEEFAQQFEEEAKPAAVEKAETGEPAKPVRKEKPAPKEEEDKPIDLAGGSEAGDMGQ